jgi:hypothetical protein
MAARLPFHPLDLALGECRNQDLIVFHTAWMIEAQEVKLQRYLSAIKVPFKKYRFLQCNRK